MRITEYQIKTSKPIKETTLACVSDLHARKYHNILMSLKTIDPEIILLAGDILEVSNEYMKKRNREALDFLRAATDIAPTYYCFGNHEIYYSHALKNLCRVSEPEILCENINEIKSYGIHLINNAYEAVKLSNGNMINIGGLVCGEDTNPELNKTEPDTSFLDAFDKLEGFKILLCHYPHYYDKYLKTSNTDIILSGHAHGGQWRVFGQGIYAPHQGIFPKLTSGIYDKRLIISRGAANNLRFIPRFFNPTEVLKITISR